MTGFITPRCKVYDEGFFSEETKDPDDYFDYVDFLKKKFKNEEIDKKKSEYQEEKNNNYVLTLSTIEPRKNMEYLIKIFT